MELGMKKVLLVAAVGSLSVSVLSAEGGTIGYWNFEMGLSEGQSDGEAILHEGDTGVYNFDVEDVSGNGHHLAVWETGGNAGYALRSNTPASTVPGAGGAPNGYSVKNTGGGPAMWTDIPSLNTWAPSAWTIEFSFKVEAGGYRTFIGRDSQGGVVNGPDPNVSAMYFQKQPDESLAIKFLDGAGHWHQAISAAGVIQGFDFGSDPDGNLAPWYSAAAVSDGSTLSLYLMNHDAGDLGYTLIAQADLLATGTTDTTLSTGHGDGGDWNAGNFSFGRGLHGGGHGDRAYGYLDEIRFSDEALSEFLFGGIVPEPATAALFALGGLAVFRRRA